MNRDCNLDMTGCFASDLELNSNLQCKICRVQVKPGKLKDGRCPICYTAYKAKQSGVHYGAYKAAHPEEPSADATEEEIIPPDAKRCVICGRVINKGGHYVTCGDPECAYQRDLQRKKKLRDAAKLEVGAR